MTKITEEGREVYAKKIEAYKTVIDKTLSREKEVLAQIEKDGAGAGYKKIALCEDMMYLSTIFMAVNSISVTMFAINNVDALNEGRKALYKAIIYLEDVVSNYIDVPYSDYEAKVAQISNIPMEKRYLLVRKLGLAMRMLMDAFGDNSKWKWAFVEVIGRFATVAKNIIEMKSALKIFYNPADKDYELAVNFIRLAKTLVGQAADKYRDKYELSSHREDDIRLAITYTLAFRRLCIIMGISDEAEDARKRAAVWNAKMEQDKKTGLCK